MTAIRSRRAVVAALLLGAMAAAVLLLAARRAPAATDAPAAPPRDQASITGPAVQAQMENVDYRILSSATLNIRRLRGELHSKQLGKPPVFDDKNSFVMKIHSAEIAMTQESMTGLFNDHVFAYPGSPLEKIDLQISRDGIVQKGVLRKALKARFVITASVTLTPKGEIRVHPTKVKVAGISVGGLMKVFGLELDRLLTLKQDRGVRIEGNDFVITPDRMLPPPQIDGTVTELQLEPGRMVLRFDSPGKPRPAPLSPPSKGVPNYMYYQGGTLCFGKLTMKGTELEIVDADPSDRFDFFLDHYNEQLVAGYDQNLPDGGLIVHMPDFDKLGRQASNRPRVASLTPP